MNRRSNSKEFSKRSSSVDNLPRMTLSATRNLHRTPLSRLSSMTPNRLDRGSSSKPTIIRESKSKDVRPLNDKAFQNSASKKLLDYLRENKYGNTSLSSKSFPLSSLEFRNIFNFLVSQLSPHYSLPTQKYDQEILNLCKALRYPGLLSKATFATMGSLHSWPAILGILDFFVTLLSSLHSTELIYFHTTDDAGFSKENLQNKYMFQFNVSTYYKFMAGNDDFSIELEELESELMAEEGIQRSEIKKLEESYKSHEIQLKNLLIDVKNVQPYQEKLELLRGDIEKVEDYSVKLIQFKEQKSNQMSKIKDKIASIRQEIEDLEIKIEKSQILYTNNDEVSLMAHITALSSSNLLMKEDMALYDEETCKREIILSKILAKEESLVRKFNRYVCFDKVEFSSFKITDVNEDLFFTKSEILSYLEREKEELKGVKESLETALTSLSEIKLKNESSEKSLEIERNNCGLLTSELKDVTQTQCEEEKYIAAKILSLREEILSVPLPKKLEDLQLNLMSLQREKEEKMKEFLAQEKEGNNFIDIVLREGKSFRENALKIYEDKVLKITRATKRRIQEIEISTNWLDKQLNAFP